MTADGFELSNVLLEQALEIEPDYPAAWAGLAFNYFLQASFLGILSFDEGYPLAREAANRALSLDPDHAEAYAVLSYIARGYDNDLVAAARYAERALELDPGNPDILGGAARLALVLGRVDEAIALGEYMVVHDPVNSSAHGDLASFYAAARRLDESIASHRTVLSLNPGGSFTRYAIGIKLLLKGEPEEALQEMERELSEVWRMIGLPMVFHSLGQAEESDAALAELIAKYEQGGAYNIAYNYAFRDEADLAFEWLARAVQYKDPGLSGISTTVLFTNVRDDPRWLPFLESIGRSPEQLAAIKFDVRVPQ